MVWFGGMGRDDCIRVSSSSKARGHSYATTLKLDLHNGGDLKQQPCCCFNRISGTYYSLFKQVEFSISNQSDQLIHLSFILTMLAVYFYLFSLFCWEKEHNILS